MLKVHRHTNTIVIVKRAVPASVHGRLMVGKEEMEEEEEEMVVVCCGGGQY